MARLRRIALDFTLVSLRKVGPVVSKMWVTTKSAITNTKAKPLVCNPLVDKTETALDKMSEGLISYVKSLRDRQLPKELEYLEKELEKVKSKIEENGKQSASKSLKPALGIAWQYAKSEIVPPMTVKIFHGPVGKKLENTVSKAANNFIVSIQNQIRNIELEEAREIKRKEAEAKAAEAKIKAEIKRKAEEVKKKEAEKLAKEEKARQQAEVEKKAQTDQKAAAEAAKAPKPKAETKQKPKRKAPKKSRRQDKKRPSPKTKK